ncbi:MAG: hypothetical protein MUC60_17535 [Oscillatoria sp. Prado101]|nr:hypothetical protein [Oscillatoria sp. Prado101]
MTSGFTTERSSGFEIDRDSNASINLENYPSPEAGAGGGSLLQSRQAGAAEWEARLKPVRPKKAGSFPSKKGSNVRRRFGRVRIEQKLGCSSPQCIRAGK